MVETRMNDTEIIKQWTERVGLEYSHVKEVVEKIKKSREFTEEEKVWLIQGIPF